MTIDFEDKEQFKKFVNAVAYAIVQEPDINDELQEDIAWEIMARHSDKLAQSIFERLIADYVRRSKET